jgi:hypothetical protein
VEWRTFNCLYEYGLRDKVTIRGMVPRTGRKQQHVSLSSRGSKPCA